MHEHRSRARVTRIISGLLAMVTVFAMTLVFAASPASAEEDVHVSATIDGKPVGASNDAHPIPLRPDKATNIVVEVRNDSKEVKSVRTVRLEGRAVGLAFFAYDTTVGLQVGPGGTERRGYQLDLGGLKGQATGLIPAKISVLDSDRHVLASQKLVTDVRGSLWSVYGVFGIMIAIFTAVALGRAIYELATHRASPNRWWRGVRFAMPGLGLGLVIVFTLSATRIFAPSPAKWFPIVLITTAAGFVLGYMTPTPDAELDDEDIEVDDTVTDGGSVDAPVTIDPSGAAVTR